MISLTYWLFTSRRAMTRSFLILAQIIISIIVSVNSSIENYQNEWVVRVEGGRQLASLLALQSGYRQLGSVLGFKDTYIWLRDDKRSQKKRGGVRLTKALNSNAKIIWADQQKIIKRHKRDFASDLESEKPLIREKRLPANNPSAINLKGRDWDGQSLYGPEDDSKSMFNDELWSQEWYLQDTRSNKNLPKLDLNVLSLYRLGVTGHGVRVAVLDDGLEYTHQDLRHNYDPEISYDVNEGDDDPMPRYDVTGMNGHGTRCAGEIAMEANNRKCGVGVAFGSSIGGIKLLDGLVNDRVEGEALGYKPELVDIYTASWGPPDDGRSLEAPGRLAREALERGVREGRNGRGSIYVWASGNGGSKFDDCGCDGYVGSIYTVAVGSASQTGRFPWYGERCPATLATTYSSGAYHDQMIATTDLKNSCTTRHTGTSASAPLAAGILALALEVNPELTWRDVQHLIVWTSEYIPLSDNPGWFKNAAGFWFNTRFGFGLMNAHSLVIASSNWTSVPAKMICTVEATYTFHMNLTLKLSITSIRNDLQQRNDCNVDPVKFVILHGSSESILRGVVTSVGPYVEQVFATDIRFVYGETKRLQFEVAYGCQESHFNEIAYLEHIELVANLDYSLRGSLQMHLAAPSGTKVQVLNPRKLDDSDAGFTGWRFMSVATWGEDPRGTWTLDISDKIGPETNNGTVKEFKLILHGTQSLPNYRNNGPRIYNYEYNRMRKTDEFISLVSNELPHMTDIKNNNIDPYPLKNIGIKIN